MKLVLIYLTAFGLSIGSIFMQNSTQACMASMGGVILCAIGISASYIVEQMKTKEKTK